MDESPAAELIASATSADLRRARALLAGDSQLARHDLACACATGEADEVSRVLAARPAAVGEPTGPFGWQPISYACYSRLLRGEPGRAPGIREVVRRLLNAGADPDAWFVHDDAWIQVPLYGAAGINGDIELTRMLLDAGADPTDDREGYHGNEVLYHACEHRDPTCAMLVIDAGACQDLVDYDLGRALNFPNHEMVEMFCTHGARADAGHLHQAAWRRRPPETVAALLDAGAPIDAPDEHGLTALQIATLWGEQETAQLLLDRKPNQPAGAVANLSPALLDEMVILAIQGGRFETVTRLLDAGARLDGDPDVDSPPPLGEACWRRRVDVAHELVQRGAVRAAARSEERWPASAIATTRRAARRCRRSTRSRWSRTRRS
jgi:ankyrin repeat protein